MLAPSASLFIGKCWHIDRLLDPYFRWEFSIYRYSYWDGWSKRAKWLQVYDWMSSNKTMCSFEWQKCSSKLNSSYDWLEFFWKVSRFSVRMTISYLSDNSLCTCIAYGRDVGGFLGEYHGFHGAQRRDTSSLKEFKGWEGIWGIECQWKEIVRILESLLRGGGGSCEYYRAFCGSGKLSCDTTTFPWPPLNSYLRSQFYFI